MSLEPSTICRRWLSHSQEPVPLGNAVTATLCHCWDTCYFLSYTCESAHVSFNTELSVACLRPSNHMRLWHRLTTEESDVYFFISCPLLGLHLFKAWWVEVSAVSSDSFLFQFTVGSVHVHLSVIVNSLDCSVVCCISESLYYRALSSLFIYIFGTFCFLPLKNLRSLTPECWCTFMKEPPWGICFAWYERFCKNHADKQASSVTWWSKKEMCRMA